MTKGSELETQITPSCCVQKSRACRSVPVTNMIPSFVVTAPVPAKVHALSKRNSENLPSQAPSTKPSGRTSTQEPCQTSTVGRPGIIRAHQASSGTVLSSRNRKVMHKLSFGVRLRGHSDIRTVRDTVIQNHTDHRSQAHHPRIFIKCAVLLQFIGGVSGFLSS